MFEFLKNIFKKLFTPKTENNPFKSDEIYIWIEDE
jgi:hypothetical protein